MRYTYTQLRAFDAVAREGSFIKAAKRLNLTQPAVSLQVRMLEEAYNVSLFDRTREGVVLTDIGRSLFELTRRMPGIDEQVHEILTSARELRTGELRLAAGAPHLVMKLIAKFLERYPDIQVSISFGNAQEVWRQLHDFKVDAVVVTDSNVHDDVTAVTIAKKVIDVVMPVGHPLANRSSINLTDLEGQPAIFRDESSLTQSIVNEALVGVGVSLRPVLQVDTREAVHEAIAAGLGIGFLFDSDIGQDERIRAVPLSGMSKDIHTVAACLKSQGWQRVVEAFLQVAKKEASAKPLLRAVAGSGAPLKKVSKRRELPGTSGATVR